MKTLHVNLVSEQLTANLIPTLIDKNCVGVILVLGDSKLQQKAKILTEIYQKNKCTIFKTFEGNSSFESTMLKQQADELITYLANEHHDKHWVLNTTGGTKPMSLAMTLAFQEYNTNRTNAQNSIDIIYTDTQNNKIHYFNHFNRSQHRPILQWEHSLDVKTLSTVNGFTIQSQTNRSNHNNIDDRKHLTEYLAKQYLSEPTILKTLQAAAKETQIPENSILENSTTSLHAVLQRLYNEAPFTKYLAKQYSSEPTILNILQEVVNLFNVEKKMDQIPENSTTSLHEVLQKLHDEKLIEWEKSNIKIPDKKNRTYLSGGWLEEYTYLKALECNFDEVSINVHGIWNKDNQQNNSTGGKNNEFDLLIAHNNQLLIIECKACFWNEKNKGYNNQDPLHKLDALGSKLGGIYKQILFISFSQVPDAMRNRINDKKITLCDNLNEIPNTLKTLRDRMSK